jgi:hypothetical protein
MLMDISSSNELHYGLRSTNTLKFDGTIVLSAFWATNSDLGTIDDWEVLAKKRFSLISGVAPRAYPPPINNLIQPTTVLTSNGNSVTATSFYVADGSGSLTPKIGADVTVAGTGTAPIDTEDHPFTLSEATKFQAGSGFKSPSGNTISTERFIIQELILNVTDTVSTQYLVGNFITNQNAIQSFITGGRIYLQITDSSPYSRNVSSVISTGWQHVILLIDRTAKTQAVYVNTVQGTTGSGTVDWPLDLSTTTEFHYGLRETDVFKFSGSLALAATYGTNVDLGVAANWQAMANERYSMFQNMLMRPYIDYTNNPFGLPPRFVSNESGVEAAVIYAADGSGSLTPRIGAAVTSAGTGTAPTNTTDHSFIGGNYSTKFNTGSGFKTSALSLSTERFLVFEGVLNFDSDVTTRQYILSNFASGVSELITIQLVSGRIYFEIKDSAGNSRNASTAITSGWHHLLMVFDTVAKTQASYIDGVQDTTGAGTATWPTSVASTEDLYFGLASTDVNKFMGAIASVFLYGTNSDLGVAANWQIAANERYRAAFGDRAYWAKLVFTRTSEKCIYTKGTDGATRVVQLGGNWPGVGQYPGDSKSYYRCEVAGSSTVEYPTDCSQVSDWTLTRVTAAKSSTVLGPINGQFANEIIGTAVNDTHYVSWDGAAGTTDHVMSVFVAAGDKTRVKLVSTASGGEDAYFDLSTGVVESLSAQMDAAGLIPLDGLIQGRKWYRLWAYYAIGAAAPHDHYIQPCAAASDTYLGDGSTVDLYFAHAQHEVLPIGYPTSPMINNVAGSTRSIETNDALAIVDGNYHKIVMDCSIDPIAAVGATQVIYDISNGSAAEEIASYLYVTNSRLEAFERAGSVLQDLLIVNTVGVNGGGILLNQNDNRSLLLTSPQGSDTGSTATNPSNLDSISLGCSLGGVGQSTNVRIHSVKITRK